MTTLGWEKDHYLWMAGAGGVVRWDVEQQLITKRTFKPDKIDQFFISNNDQIWAFGNGVWRFESSDWIEISENAGLQPGKIQDMVQTDDGTIWISTWNGFKIWNENTQLWEPTQINQPAKTLIEGPDDSVWFGLVKDGVIRLQDGKLTHWTTSEGLIGDKVESMLLASNGTIWVGTHQGASRWDGTSWQGWNDFGYPDPDGLVVYKLYETSDGNIWAVTSEDLAKWDGENWTTYQQNPFCLPNFTLLETDDGTLWAGCSTGLFRWTGSSWREYGKSEGIPDNSFSRLIQGTNGILYASTKSGLYQYNPVQDYWQSFPNSTSFFNRLRALFNRA